MAGTTAMIRATGLTKSFKEVRALAGLDLEVEEGRVLALLGPNGAGKTTAVRVLTTLLRPDSGTASIAGVDLLGDPVGVRRRIGLSGQYAAVDEHLTGYENLLMVGRLYQLGSTRSRRRARELLERFDLEEAADRPAKTYSGGMRRRLDLAGALVAEPPVLVLDEPTTGLDPRSRQQMWDVIRELVASGSTLLLTTQYLEEADRLADEILVIDQGRAIARGTADQLKARTGGERVEVVLTDARHQPAAQRLLQAVATEPVRVSDNRRELTAAVGDGQADLLRVLQEFAREEVTVFDVGLRRPTLDDVFLSLTGHEALDESRDGVAGTSAGGSGTSAADDGDAASARVRARGQGQGVAR